MFKPGSNSKNFAVTGVTSPLDPALLRKLTVEHYIIAHEDITNALDLLTKYKDP